MELRRITGVFGAELIGLNLSGAISDDVAEALRAALAEHLVLVLPSQSLDRDAQRRLARVFGPPEVNPYAPGPDDAPEVTRIVKEADERTGVFGGGWHTDLSFLDQPPGGSVLYGVEIPPQGGDTMFASQQAAWDSLPEPLKSLLDGRKVAHVGKPYGVKWAPPPEEQAMKGATRRGDPDADRERWHPAVLTHPKTGRRSLYLNPTYTLRIEGLSEAESLPLLRQIQAHATLPEHTMRLRWHEGMVVVWDNFSTQHYAIDDYRGHRREMRRVVFGGQPISAWQGGADRAA